MRWMRLGALGVMMLGAVLACGGVAQGATVSRPSFDCQKARGMDEKAICASPDLMRLDRQLDIFYHTIAGCAAMGGRGELIDNQRRWLAKRTQCGGNRACLSQLYRKRLALFAPYAVKARRMARHQMCPGAAMPPLD